MPCWRNAFKPALCLAIKYKRKEKNIYFQRHLVQCLYSILHVIEAEKIMAATYNCFNSFCEGLRVGAGVHLAVI